MKNSNSLGIENIRSDKWLDLSYRKRLDILQLIENSYASMCGRLSRSIKIGRHFTANDIAEYVHPKTIYIKESFIKSDSPYSGYDAAYSVFHEGYHAFQRDCIDGKISSNHLPCSEKIELWKKNFEVYRDVYLYDSYSDYRFQPIEKDAYDFAGKQLKSLSSLFSNDPCFHTCILGYEANERMYVGNAQRLYGEDYEQKIIGNIIARYNEKYGLSELPHATETSTNFYKSLDEVISDLESSPLEHLEGNKLFIDIPENER